MSGHLVLLVAALSSMGACSAPSVSTPVIERVTPAYGPLGGGTVVEVAGAGFATGDRVFIGGREAPLVHAIDVSTLEVVIPPASQPGDTEVIVLSGGRVATSRGVFHYSEPPAIDSVSPGEVVFTSTETRIFVTGSGFALEGAGEPVVVLDGLAVTDAIVVNDTTLTFTAPPGRAFARPEISIANQRGVAVKQRALHYTPSERPGLLLFPRWSGEFVVFFEPVDGTTVRVPMVSSSGLQLTSVVRDTHGDYWGADVSNRVGRVDLAAQSLEDPIAQSWRIPALVSVGDDIFAFARAWNSGWLGRLDPESGTLTPISGASIACCGSLSLATDGATVWATTRADSSQLTIGAIDTVTGQLAGTQVPVGTAGFRSRRCACSAARCTPRARAVSSRSIRRPARSRRCRARPAATRRWRSGRSAFARRSRDSGPKS